MKSHNLLDRQILFYCELISILHQSWKGLQNSVLIRGHFFQRFYSWTSVIRVTYM